ncbi:MAG: DMSO/selenate family reductase complex A subunit [Bacteroidales bacterium]|jgi:anaerobic dimethyl sulfoxide reductase subunit A|nr:DMSO/selenate family reductase complex A subunit [Bacteroidales bacterium]
MKPKHRITDTNTDSIPPSPSRREFLKLCTFLGGGVILSGGLLSCIEGSEKIPVEFVEQKGEVSIVRTGCPAHNCGGRCVLKLHIKENKIIRIETDDRPTDTLEDPQLRACIRGRSYRRRQYHPDRLKYPMKRIGERGEGKFEPISWDEALDLLANQIKRVKQKYGNSSLLVPYGTGSYNQLNGRQTAARLMNLIGGSLGFYNSYSWACISKATPYVYGTSVTGNQRQDWVNSKYIIMWGWNPAEMRDGTNSDFFIKKARENGAKVICIDPRMSMSAVALADEWIPIRPGTDVAMMSAMAYTIIQNNLHDKDFIDRCCMGFDESQMPEGYEDKESYSDYILGKSDRIAKTPAWAEKICGVPAQTIERIAHEYATQKPSVLYQGYGMQRRAYGEQVVIAGCALPAITGNVGVSGGWAGGLALQADDGGPFWNVFPTGENPVQARIPVFLWTEAILRGKEMGFEEGVRGVERLESNIKLIWSVASNILINQHADTNRSAKILKDPSLVEFIAVQDQFMTPSAKFADLILPVCTQLEMWGLEDGWKYGDEVIIMPKTQEPPYQTKSDYQICTELAERFGVKKKFTQNRSEREWIEWAVARYKNSRFPEIPELERLKKENTGVYSKPVDNPAIAFENFRKNPKKYPLRTPSGKVELFSKTLFDMGKPDTIPAVPKYIQEWESPFGKEARKYPLQALGHHYMARVHSTHDGIDWLDEAFPQRVFINPLDAQERGIQNGEEVLIFNDRGKIRIPCRITPKIMPGVVNIPQGAWWNPDADGVDRRGNINVLTSHQWTPLAYGNAQHTIMVEVKKI